MSIDVQARSEGSERSDQQNRWPVNTVWRLWNYHLPDVKSTDLLGYSFSGWLPDENRFDVWGRPVGLLVLSDGSLLITDEGGNQVRRVSYGKW